jgi:hypothetical protein
MSMSRPRHIHGIHVTSPLHPQHPCHVPGTSRSIKCFIFEEARRQAAASAECLRRAHADASDLAAVEDGIRKQVRQP